MTTSLSRFSSPATCVFWYIDDCPVPNDIEPSLIYHNIRSVAKQLGCVNSNYTIFACGKEKLGEEYFDADFFSVAIDSGVESLIWRIIMCAKGYNECGLELVVISKNLPNDPEFNRILHALKSRCCKVGLIQPSDNVSSESLFQTVASVSLYARLLPTDHSGSSQGVDIINPDFSNPIKLDIRALRTVIFWDVVDYPIPDDVNPILIYQRIRESLKSKGYMYVGQMSIWAYDEKKNFSDEMLAKYREARFYFIPGGNKNERVKRMLHDMLLWVLDSPEDGRAPPHLIVISNNHSGEVNLSDSFKYFNLEGYNVFSVPSSKDASGDLVSSVWPECLLDRGEVIGSRITFYKPMKKKKPKEQS